MSVKNCLPVVTFFLLTSVSFGQDLARERVESALRFLADDLLEGRGTPGRGLDISALYLVSELRASGWQPGAGDAYLHPFEVGYFNPKDAEYRVVIGGVELEKEEFTLLPFGLDPADTPLKARVVFAGQGVFAPERGVDDYGDIDLEGKAVVALHGAPWAPDQHAPHSYDRVIGKSVRPTVGGASCFIYVTEEMDAAEKTVDTAFIREMKSAEYSFLAQGGGTPTMGMGVVLALSPGVFDKVLARSSGRSYQEWMSFLAESRFAARELDSELELTIDAKARSGRTSNVVAVIPGKDPELKDEWVVLTAHYDHLGYKEVAQGEDGIWNGADDNASGTAALLEIGRNLASGKGPRRSLMIMFTSGEDRGMLGSAFYAREPLVPFESVVVNLNVDMVGRSSGNINGYTVGSYDVLEEAQKFGRQAGIELVPDPNLTWRVAYFVDSYHFARFDVPYLEFFAEMHEDYHQPSDEVDKINFEGLMDVVEVVTQLARYYAEGAPRPVTPKRPEWFLTPE